MPEKLQASSAGIMSTSVELKVGVAIGAASKTRVIAPMPTPLQSMSAFPIKQPFRTACLNPGKAKVALTSLRTTE